MSHEKDEFWATVNVDEWYVAPKTVFKKVNGSDRSMERSEYDGMADGELDIVAVSKTS